MTNLEVFCRDKKLDGAAAMDALQDATIISDNCIKLADVFGKDQWRAMTFLNDKYFPKRPATW